jgi:alpha-2-macroglobulin
VRIAYFRFLLLLIFLLPPWFTAAQAEGLRDFSPQGAVKQALRATAIFTTDMVALGASDADAPFAVTCAVEGHGRWLDSKTWQYTLKRRLVNTEHCSFKPRAGLKTLAGEVVEWTQPQYEFFVAGPWLAEIQPYANSRIAEDQYFIVQPPLAINRQSLQQHAWCEAQSLGERMPITLLNPAQLKQAAQALQLEVNPNAVAFRCQRPLPAGDKIRLVWTRGLSATTGVKLQQDEAQVFQVRPAFRAELLCTREKPDAPCSPLSDIELRFSDEVRIEDAQKIRLSNKTAAREPQQVSPARAKVLLAQNPQAFYAQHTVLERDHVDSVVFKGPFAPGSAFTLSLPADFKDMSGRALSNASSFPLKTQVGALPPLAKFAADFGILEAKQGGVLPVTLRNVESKLDMRVLGTNEPENMLALMGELQQFEQQSKTIPPAKKTKQPHADNEQTDDAQPSVDYLYPRELSFLANKPQAQPAVTLPKPLGGKAFEVLGIPLTKPGFYVVELQSQLLAQALLSDTLAHPRPMYVRSQALVTDMAVHFKKGRDNSVVWVTSLSTAKPVAGASVTIFDCNTQPIWQAKTDAQGLAQYPQALPELNNCKNNYAYFVSAKLGEDFSFVRSDWLNGIEPWRFNVQTWASQSSPKFNTMLDRTMLRAGETVSMKHIARAIDYQGYAYPQTALPKTAIVELIGGDFSMEIPLTWDKRGVATSQWQIPQDAKLGNYGIKMQGAWDYTAQFRVSEFRLPVFKGSAQGVQNRYAGVKSVPVRLSLAYLNGGAASAQPVTLSAVLSPSVLTFSHYPEFNFQYEEEPQASTPTLLLDKQAIKLDAHGGAQVNVPLQLSQTAQALKQAVDLQTEMSFNDPNGEVQTISGTTQIWPAKLAVGLQVADWAGLRGKHKVQALVLDPSGTAQAGVKVSIQAQRTWQYVHRKRILGGFYSYESSDNHQDLGTLCESKTDAQGLLQCQIEVKQAGNVQLQAQAADVDGNISRASAGFWVSDEADIWFNQGDQDRMEVIPEKREYQPGETARLQVHSPFYHATALIAIEREGVLKTMVQPLYRRNALITIPIAENWGPNVFVSVLAVRGRVSDVPWYSFFDWGWHSPVDWLQAKWQGGSAPTAMVDLAKPAFKLGLTRIAVGTQSMRLNVDVKPDKSSYQPRQMVSVKVAVRLPNGQAAPAGAEVAFAAVDKALLELSPNSTWNLLDNMQQERAYLIETSTAQMQVVGKRHFGKKALPAGGGGGKLSSRELFNTLLYWNPRLKLDAQGMANIRFPLNDALTAFKLVAIADVGAGLFGTGEAEIQSKQDLQIISGIPPMVREGDSYRAMLTVRNTTQRAMKVALSAQIATPANAGKKLTQSLAQQSVNLAAGASTDLAWQLTVPGNISQQTWQISAQEMATDSQTSKAQDSLRLTQQVLPRVPVTVQQSTLVQLDQPYRLSTVLPTTALAGKGGIQINLSASLAQQTAGINRYFQEYPFNCLEQKTSIATGLQDPQKWQEIVNNLAGYQDSYGYLSYFPGMAHGSEVLTAYVLSMAYENKMTLPPAVEQKMQQALLDFVQGRTKPAGWYWGSREYLNERRLAALAALAYTGNVRANMLTAFEFKPLELATSSLLDWYAILKHVPDAEMHDERMQQIARELHNRLQNIGGRLLLSAQDMQAWRWAMLDDEVNTTRLLNLLADDPVWQADMPALLRGALFSQKQGHWRSTLANAWGRLALTRFGQQFEREAVTGISQLEFKPVAKPAVTQTVDWSTTNQPTLNFAWDSAGSLHMQHQGTGQPWAQILTLAAVPAQNQFSAYKIKRSISPIQQKQAGQWSRGDMMRVRIEVESMQNLNWVVLSDPIPAGASILGNTARDSKIAQAGENQYDAKNQSYPSYTERGLGYFRAYYEYLPQGHFWYEYTLRLNNPGEFNLPATRVEAMYAPEVFGQLVNTKLKVQE